MQEFSIVGEPPRLSAGPRYNVAPTQPVAVIREAGPNKERTLETLRWGLIPSWAKDPTVGNRMINARVETLAVKPAFRDAFKARRCLVVANGFYEWKREGRAKQPFYVRREDGALLAMAGLWDRWMSPDGEIIETFTVVTKPAVPPVSEIHDRMPAILAEMHHAAWLDAGVSKQEALFELLEAPSPELVTVPVSTFVNKPANDGPECIEPIAIVGGLFDRL